MHKCKIPDRCFLKRLSARWVTPVARRRSSTGSSTWRIAQDSGPLLFPIANNSHPTSRIIPHCLSASIQALQVTPTRLFRCEHLLRHPAEALSPPRDETTRCRSPISHPAQFPEGDGPIPRRDHRSTSGAPNVIETHNTSELAFRTRARPTAGQRRTAA